MSKIYSSTYQVLKDLESRGDLLRVKAEIDPYLEMGMIQRAAFQAGLPCLLFERVRGSSIPCVANLYGTHERARYILRHGFDAFAHAIECKADPLKALSSPLRSFKMLYAGLHTWPRQRKIAYREARISELPNLVSWPLDGGGFVTLPGVLTFEPGRKGWFASNLGMYRVQLSGNEYQLDREIGLHYQTHRGIGVHHAKALERQEDLWVQVAVGGPPSLAFSAVMPLPEGLPEVLLANFLSHGGLGYQKVEGVPVPVLSGPDVVIVGRVRGQETKPEGPFGDHLGYYSLTHDFPLLRVERVLVRPDAVWPFTTVGRPPQEDTVFGDLIHELVGPAIPSEIPGVREVHAVDESGVHPLLLAVGRDSYQPFRDQDGPGELHTLAHAILGKGQLSLAKYLILVAPEVGERVVASETRDFFHYFLERVDWSRDCFFMGGTTIDTLDYSGGALHQGSKVVWSASGSPRRELASADLLTTRKWWSFKRFEALDPGILICEFTSSYQLDQEGFDPELARISKISLLEIPNDLKRYPLWVVVDDSEWVASDWKNFLWATFTKSNPAADIYGFASKNYQRAWGCEGPLVIDARRKPHHAPALEVDLEAKGRLFKRLDQDLSDLKVLKDYLED